MSICLSVIIFRENAAESLLDLDIFNLSTPSAPSTTSDKKKSTSAASTPTAGGSGVREEEEEEGEDNVPLFWQPGKRGYYSPRAGRRPCSAERLNAFRNCGR